MQTRSELNVYLGEALARYSFGEDHPFGPKRYDAFRLHFESLGLDKRSDLIAPVVATERELLRFHTDDYLEQVKTQSVTGAGYLDYGDTPAFPGVYEAASTVVGTVLDGLRRIMERRCRRVFVPIAGLHHARRDSAAGFCVFNDCGVAIESLLGEYACARVAYVDIDAHHGDGVYYAFEGAPGVIFADLHQDGRTLYPGTGFATETGTGHAKGTKLNVPMPPGSDDTAFLEVWPRVEALIAQFPPEVILFQCGADSIAGDPITQMHYSPKAHAHAATRLRLLADAHCEGRLLAMGGGGYDLSNLAHGWCEVVAAMS
jgi:acetoin utilization protein AcuC